MTSALVSDTPIDTPAERSDTPTEPLSGGTPTDGAADGNAAREARRARMRELASRPRTRRPRIGQPKWLQRLDDDVAAAERNPQYLKALRELRSELAALEGKPSETLIKATARQTAIVAYLDAATFSAGLNGGVNKHKKRVHELIEQRREQYADLLSLRRRCGLDAESVTHALSFSDAFKQLVVEGDEVDHAQTLRAARERAGLDPETGTRAKGAPIVEPAALLLEAPCEPLASPSEASPNRSPPVVEPLQLAQDEPREPESAVEDMGNPKVAVIPKAAPAPPAPDYSRPDIPRNRFERINGEMVRFDGDGFAMPSPWLT